MVDGRVLNSLTKEDLKRHLKITKKLDQLSFTAAVELLRMHEFNREVSGRKGMGRRWRRDGEVMEGGVGRRWREGWGGDGGRGGEEMEGGVGRRWREG